MHSQSNGALLQVPLQAVPGDNHERLPGQVSTAQQVNPREALEEALLHPAQQLQPGVLPRRKVQRAADGHKPGANPAHRGGPRNEEVRQHIRPDPPGPHLLLQRRTHRADVRVGPADQAAAGDRGGRGVPSENPLETAHARRPLAPVLHQPEQRDGAGPGE